MQTDQASISVIVPTYNQGQFIEETLKSIITQQGVTVQLIVIDGGSNDATLDVVKRYGSHISYFVSEKDSGQSEAINKGLRVATGDIITWLNSDDRYRPGCLQKVARLFAAHPEMDIIHGKCTLFGEGIKPSLIGTDQPLHRADYLPYMRFPQPSSFIRAGLVQRLGPVSEHLHYAMDYEWMVRALLLGAGFQQTPDVFSDYRLHPASKSNHELLFLREWAQVFYHVLCSLPHASQLAQQLVELGLAEKQNTPHYPCSTHFSAEELEDAFCQHLHLQFHTLYRHYRYAECRKLARFIRKTRPADYQEKQYKKFILRMAFVPKFAFRFARRQHF